jgi:endoribonuclease Dicer
LNHFCSVLPNARHTSYIALYDINPPDLPEGWHALGDGQQDVPMYPGPFGCTLTLPKPLPPQLRVYTVERKYPSKRSAYQHVAFKAYLELYNSGLLNDHLLPLTSVVEPRLDEEVKDMLKDIDKRGGTATVTSQLNPWLPSSDEENWWSTEITVEGLPSLTLLTPIKVPALGADELPVLHHPQRGRIGVKLGPRKVVRLSQEELTAARENARRLFWSHYGSRMQWARLDFAYLFVINADPDADTWLSRRSWAMEIEEANSERVHSVNAEAFALQHGYSADLTWVRDGRSFGKLYRFVGWHYEKLTEEEEAEICGHRTYSRFEEFRVTYPLLVVEPLPQRCNFLLPLPVSNATPKPLFLLAKYSYLELLSPAECEYSQFIPSILRRLETAMIVKSLRTTLFPRAPLAKIPSPFLTTATTAPVAGDPTNYERLETLGDAVLKFIVAVNLMAAYPLWHEGYLTRRKDHAVANSRLAKEAVRRSIFRWIIRTRFSPKKFKPLYLSAPEEPIVAADSPQETNDEPVVERRKTHKEVEELSTKMLADVVESLIGAAYLHGDFDLGVSCAQLFGLGLEWHTLPECVEMALSRVERTDEASTQLNNVERMLGYTFQRKLLLVESLTHASYQYDDRTVSYERMEFLGDALLDMIVADFLYKYPGKTYSPHDIHIRKSAVVNTHFLAYICLRSSLNVDASMPGPGPRGEIVMQPNTNTIRLFQSLQHSSPVILEDQKLTFHRYDKVKDEIEAAFTTGTVFPWAALTRLQAPKVFSDMIESFIGAVYLDSKGNIDTVKALLWKLGVLSHLDRIIRDNVDVLHPVSRLSVWASRQQKPITYEYTEEKGRVICTISVEGREAVNASAQKKGHASQEEARFAAAEKAISVWAVGLVTKPSL